MTRISVILETRTLRTAELRPQVGDKVLKKEVKKAIKFRKQGHFAVVPQHIGYKLLVHWPQYVPFVPADIFEIGGRIFPR